MNTRADNPLEDERLDDPEKFRLEAVLHGVSDGEDIKEAIRGRDSAGLRDMISWYERKGAPNGMLLPFMRRALQLVSRS